MQVVVVEVLALLLLPGPWLAWQPACMHGRQAFNPIMVNGMRLYAEYGPTHAPLPRTHVCLYMCKHV